MEKEFDNKITLDNEIKALEGKLKDLKKGYEKTIHDFADGIVNQKIINLLNQSFQIQGYIEKKKMQCRDCRSLQAR